MATNKMKEEQLAEEELFVLEPQYNKCVIEEET